MTISEILPKKKECSRHYNLAPNICDCGAKGYNQAIADCHAALTKAFNDGTLCWRPSEEMLFNIIHNTNVSPIKEYKAYVKKEVAEDIAKSILNLLKGTKE